MYHNCDDFRIMASNADFLSAITATLYPYYDLTESQAATPLVEVKVKNKMIIFFEVSLIKQYLNFKAICRSTLRFDTQIPKYSEKLT